MNGKYQKVARGIKPTIKEMYYLIPDDKKPDWDFEEIPLEEQKTIINVPKTKTKLDKKQKLTLLGWIVLGIFALIYFIFKS